MIATIRSFFLVMKFAWLCKRRQFVPWDPAQTVATNHIFGDSLCRKVAATVCDVTHRITKYIFVGNLKFEHSDWPETSQASLRSSILLRLAGLITWTWKAVAARRLTNGGGGFKHFQMITCLCACVSLLEVCLDIFQFRFILDYNSEDQVGGAIIHFGCFTCQDDSRWLCRSQSTARRSSGHVKRPTLPPSPPIAPIGNHKKW